MCNAQADVRFVPIADTPPLFDHLVGAGKYCRRNGEAERLRGFEIDHKFVFGRGLDRKVSCLFALEDAIDIVGRAPVLINKIGSP